MRKRFHINLMLMRRHMINLRYTDQDKLEGALRIQAWWRCILNRRASLVFNVAWKSLRVFYCMELAAKKIQTRFRTFYMRKRLMPLIRGRIELRKAEQNRVMESAFRNVVRLQRAFRLRLAVSMIDRVGKDDMLQCFSVFSNTTDGLWVRSSVFGDTSDDLRSLAIKDSSITSSHSTRATTAGTQGHDIGSPRVGTAETHWSTQPYDGSMASPPTSAPCITETPCMIATRLLHAASESVITDGEKSDQGQFYQSTATDAVQHKIGGRTVKPPKGALRLLRDTPDVEQHGVDHQTANTEGLPFAPSKQAVSSGWYHQNPYMHGRGRKTAKPLELMSVRALTRGESPGLDSTSLVSLKDSSLQEMQERKLCPKCHALKDHMTEGGSCDGCGIRVPPGGSVMDCRECDWWICRACYACYAGPEEQCWRRAFAQPPPANLKHRAKDRAEWNDRLRLAESVEPRVDECHPLLENTAPLPPVAAPLGRLRRPRVAQRQCRQASQ